MISEIRRNFRYHKRKTAEILQPLPNKQDTGVGPASSAWEFSSVTIPYGKAVSQCKHLIYAVNLTIPEKVS